MADLWEVLAEAGPEDTCLVAGRSRHTRGSLDARGNQVAHLLADNGVVPGDRVALYSRNRVEYVEAILGCWKVGAVPVNINWRYTAAELSHVLEDAGAEVVIAERGYLPVLEQAAASGTTLRRAIVLEDGSAERGKLVDTSGWELGVDQAPSSHLEGVPRSGNDLYLLYTGGTTGMPRGVAWRHEDFFRACALSGDPAGVAPVLRPEDMAAHATTSFAKILILAPLMHGGGQWPTFIALYSGGTAILYCERSFDPHSVLELVAQQRPVSMGVVGDAMARPLAEAALARPGRHDVSSLAAIGNGGAMISAAVKGQLRQAFPGATLTDSFGASETGATGSETVEDTSTSRPAFAPNPSTAVLHPETLDPVPPGSATVGLLARTGHIPLGYWNDPVKTAATFRIDRHGVRWVLPGDHALVDDQGRVVLLGRGSGCINSGGEKIFPEEVEAALRSHPAVHDAVVVGVPDPRWGQAVVAMVSLRDGAEALDPDELRQHCRSQIAGYKVPRRILKGKALRTNTGKPDYAGVRQRVLAQLAPDQPAASEER